MHLGARRARINKWDGAAPLGRVGHTDGAAERHDCGCRRHLLTCGAIGSVGIKVTLAVKPFVAFLATVDRGIGAIFIGVLAVGVRWDGCAADRGRFGLEAPKETRANVPHDPVAVSKAYRLLRRARRVGSLYEPPRRALRSHAKAPQSEYGHTPHRI